MGKRPGAALLLALATTGLGACAAPTGVPIGACASDWEPTIVQPPSGATREPQLVELECWRPTGDRRMEVGFLMPAGPTCREVERVEVLEGPDGVSVSVFVGERLGPLIGACPEDALPWAVEVQLRDALGDRPVLDGARLDE